MGGINEQHVEWAVVSRLATMLNEPQHRVFDATHTYALFVPILCWTMQRMRQNDPKGRVLQDRLRQGRVAGANRAIPDRVEEVRCARRCAERVPLSSAGW
jgi:hypothetical protein